MPLIAIVGRPNTGKSTLFNRLAGSKKALVDGIPGVTRDLHYARVHAAGRDFDLVDTGGLSIPEPGELSGKVVEQVEFAIQEADAIVFLLDARDGLTPDDEDIAARLRKSGKPVFHVANKVESPRQEERAMEFYRLGPEKVYCVSARENIGVGELFSVVTQAFPKRESEEEDSAVTRVAIVGKPNVGKSSLVNRLLGAERMIVSAQPGTTRDSIDLPFTFNDTPYLLIDTAGIRRKAKVHGRLEKFSVIKALRSLDRCHVALVMGDAREAFSDQMLRVTSEALERGRALIWLFNKIDLVEDLAGWREDIRRRRDLRLRHLSYIPCIEVSAKTGKGQKKIFPLVENVSRAHNHRIETGPLNRIIEKALQAHSPPMAGNRDLKIYYAAQTSVRPPTFVLFTNAPDAVHFSYRRYLSRVIRESGDFTGTPIRLLFKKKPRS